MKIAIFGATGGTGLHLLGKLLGTGLHSVSCLVRNPNKLPKNLNRDKLSIVVGEATDEKKVSETLTGADTVIVTLGGRPKGPGWNICSRAQPFINHALMKECPAARMVVVSSIGVGDHYKHLSLPGWFFAYWVIWDALQDKLKQENSVKDDIKNWVIVRPGGLTDKPGKAKWTAAPDACSFSTMIPREDVAAFIVQECLPGSDQWLNKAVAVVS